MMKHPLPSLLLASSLIWGLSGCDKKNTTQVDPAQQKALQDMQAKVDALSQQIAERAAADNAAKKAELEKMQADLDRQKADLEAERQSQANVSTAQQPTPDTTDSNPAQAAPASYDLFYTRLQNQGDWIETTDYGYIWQPRIAQGDANWRPYTDGHWVETDRGWTWVSNEPFGWATYHYGRWVEIDGTGWCWVPGTEWAPAWVSWRTSDRYVGWAPLPPEARDGRRINGDTDLDYGTGPDHYTFVVTQDFGEPTYLGRVVAPQQNVVIIAETTNVTDITYNHTVVYNNGPDYDLIRVHSRQPVGRYQIQLDLDRHNPDFGPARVQGSVLAIAAPLIAQTLSASSSVAEKPQKVQKKIAHTERNQGWKGYNPDQVRAVKEQMKARPSHPAATPAATVATQPSQFHPVAPTATPARTWPQQTEGQNPTPTATPPHHQPTSAPNTAPVVHTPVPTIPKPVIMPSPVPHMIGQPHPTPHPVQPNPLVDGRVTPVPTNTPHLPPQVHQIPQQQQNPPPVVNEQSQPNRAEIIQQAREKAAARQLQQQQQQPLPQQSPQMNQTSGEPPQHPNGRPKHPATADASPTPH